jgi:hypothetical protein
MSASYLPGPWIRLHTADGAVHWCQPDGLIHSDYEQRVIVCEVKSSHVINAYWQLKAKYEPVVRVLFPGCEVTLIEFARVGDAMIPWPEPINLVDGPADARSEMYNLCLGFAK